MSKPAQELHDAFRAILSNHWTICELITLLIEHQDDQGAAGEITEIGRKALYQALDNYSSQTYELVSEAMNVAGIEP